MNPPSHFCGASGVAPSYAGRDGGQARMNANWNPGNDSLRIRGFRIKTQALALERARAPVKSRRR